MLSYIFSGILNLVTFGCFALFVISLIGLIIFSIMKFFGKDNFKDDKGEQHSTEENLKTFKISTIFLFCATIFLWIFNYGFTLPTDASEMMKQRGSVADQELKEIEDKKNAEKLANEQKKAEEKLAKEKKEAEEKAEKERLKQEKIAAERQAKIDAENNDKNNHDFIEISAVALMNELKANAARTKNNFDDRYVKITNATVTNIESDGDYVSLNGYGLANIQCFPKYQSTREQIFALNSGQMITVYGKITHVGEIAGFSLELLKIE